MDEIESIFNILKNSKIDINKMNKMSYADILDKFYNEFDKKEGNENPVSDETAREASAAASGNGEKKSD